MRSALVMLAALGCRSSESTAVAPPTQAPTPADARVARPPDEMDEKMRHCPLAVTGAQASLTDIDGGVRFSITAPEPQVAEVRRRAHHIVEFAAKRTRDGHGGFDGKGGGRMRNCPVVTDDVSIIASELDGGAQLDIVTSHDVAALRAETRERAHKFPFVGATIHVDN